MISTKCWYLVDHEPNDQLILDYIAVDKSGHRLEIAIYHSARIGRITLLHKLLDLVRENTKLIEINGHVLNVAAEEGRDAVIEFMGKRGVPMDIPNSKNETPLLMAARYGQIDCVKLVLSLGANINAQDMYGTTALHWSARNGNIEKVKLLLNNGADTDLVDTYGRRPIDRARALKRVECIELLESVSR
ncbi:MAG: ankyrin repeat domain-containing protein [Chthonomonadales bacterium]